mmetsp:Transcript_10150/g.23774  ORF Transcript_10150/g.23774 Transcript_10150/m.23774 type:complete len:89 (-) Transcript_10150:751-1017(-)
MKSALLMALVGSTSSLEVTRSFADYMSALSYFQQSDDKLKEPCACGNGKAKIFGVRGPHAALVPAAELYNAQLEDGSLEIEICFGSER